MLWNDANSNISAVSEVSLTRLSNKYSRVPGLSSAILAGPAGHRARTQLTETRQAFSHQTKMRSQIFHDTEATGQQEKGRDPRVHSVVVL